MKKSISHLPENKKAELEKIANITRELCDDVEMIILFGSYARGDWKEESDLKPDRKSGHVSDYDILVVTGKKETADNVGIWKDVSEKTFGKDFSTHAVVIAIDIQNLNIKLAENHFFYRDIKKEGRMLYNSGRFKLAGKRKLKPEEMKRIAQDHFDHHFENSERFYRIYQFCLDEKDYKRAAFALNQVTESSYKAILLVFKNSNPHQHQLRFLNRRAGRRNKEIKELFKEKNKEERRLFDLLNYAYIGARYDASYRIEKEELEFLAKRVKRLMEITEEICKEKIGSFVKNGK